MRGFVALGACVLLLAGCASPDMGDDSPSAGPALTQAQKDDALCRSYGTYPGTTPYVQCRLGLRTMAEQQAQNRSVLADLFGN